MNSFLKPDSPIEYLKGVGPQKGALLRKHLGLEDVQSLLFYFPFRYVDKSQINSIFQCTEEGRWVQLMAKVIGLVEKGSGSRKPLIAEIQDSSGSLELIWFQSQTWVQNNLVPGKYYRFYGRLQKSGYGLCISHPEFEEVDNPANYIPRQPFDPVYSTTEALAAKGLDSRGIRRLMDQLFQSIDLRSIHENLPEYILKRYHLPHRREALMWIHFPASLSHIEIARSRFKFEELFSHQLRIIHGRIQRSILKQGYVWNKPGRLYQQFCAKHLPFELTLAQKRVIEEILRDFGSGHQMNRLLQGDVGSGKTIVAFLMMLVALDHGFQACIMAPTEVLAHQHYTGFAELLDKLGLKTALLSSQVKGRKRKEILEQLEKGELQIIIGTHALIEDQVIFQNLGFVVIDEQHRFGVEQRSKLWSKSKSLHPHVLVMTATPIPRTLAMTLYGDLEVSIIDELPPHRKEIKTMHIRDRHRPELVRFMRQQIAEGRQVYIVYPLIEESEKLDLENLQLGYEKLLSFFPLPQYRIAVVHGKLKSEDKNLEMNRFAKGIAHIMVATTVIEVGVNVPNASVMVIENAERFGLSQLHQLRGRVGRGPAQSYCILMSSNKLSDDAMARLQIMVDTNDGFRIAEEDLKIRGPGDLAGTKQSGLIELKVADLVEDQQLLLAARKLAEAILQRDPQLSHPQNVLLKKWIGGLDKKPGWDKIG
ncbi:MAG: ATP-dependent DNA helicase RecG [Saprospiraceae bacterium]|nr:ATP-dependent DNA helicase RecG [Saprospiraceae bacterium]